MSASSPPPPLPSPPEFPLTQGEILFLEGKLEITSKAGITYKFHYPNALERVELDYRVRTLRARRDPASVGDVSALSQENLWYTWGCAAFEFLLRGCSPNAWPYNEGPKAQPNAEKFPDGCTDEVVEVALGLSAGLLKFRPRWDPKNPVNRQDGGARGDAR